MTRLTEGGGLFFALPLQNSGPTVAYKIQTAFDRPGKLIEENLTLLTSGPSMTSQVRSKSKCLTIWRIWFCRALQPYHWK